MHASLLKPSAGLCSLLLLSVSAVHATPKPQDWQLSNVVKTLELHGSVAQAITAYTIKGGSAPSSPRPFYLAYSAQEYGKLAYAEFSLPAAGSEVLLPHQDEGLDPQDPTTHLVSLNLTADALNSLQSGEDVTLTARSAFSHLVKPLPEMVKQDSKQLLFWQGDVGVRTPYPASKGRVKVQTPTPNIKDYQPKGADATKAGNKITFGPYDNIAPYTKSSVAQGSVHYEHPVPVLSVVTLDRVVEVSHWGDNLAFEDRIWLRNNGPQLKGFFSRIEYQKASFSQTPQAHTLVRFPMALPPGARDAYFIDQIGNVSTSRFRPTPPSPDSISTPSNHLSRSKSSLIEIQPRYPVLGGWNYTFSVGFNTKLGAGGWGRQLTGGEYSVAVPFLTPVGDAVPLDHVKSRIVLPEGASGIKVFLPFPVDKQTLETYTTYLDTTGRPSIVLEKTNCSEKHSQLIYIQYRLSAAGHLRKPIAVSAVILALFVLAGSLRRFDPKIKAT